MFTRVGAPPTVVRVYRVRSSSSVLKYAMLTSLRSAFCATVLPWSFRLSSTFALLPRHFHGALDRPTRQRRHRKYIIFYTYLSRPFHFHNHRESPFVIHSVYVICDDQLMAYIVGPSTLDINGACASMFHVTTSTQYTFASPSSIGLVRRPSRNEAHHGRVPPHRLHFPSLLVHHVLLHGLPMDVDPMALLRQPDRRRTAGCRCDTHSGIPLLEKLSYGLEAVPYVLSLWSSCLFFDALPFVNGQCMSSTCLGSSISSPTSLFVMNLVIRSRASKQVFGNLCKVETGMKVESNKYLCRGHVIMYVIDILT